MKLRIPPVLLTAFCGVGAWLLAAPALAGRYALPLLSFAGAMLLCASAVLLMISVGTFLRARTTVDPRNPEAATSLVTSGLYRISRNPMYLAMAMLLTGEALVLQHAFALLAPACFVWMITVFQIKPEERALADRFGADYRTYRQRTRRWI